MAEEGYLWAPGYSWLGSSGISTPRLISTFIQLWYSCQPIASNVVSDYLAMFWASSWFAQWVWGQRCATVKAINFGSCFSYGLSAWKGLNVGLHSTYVCCLSKYHRLGGLNKLGFFPRNYKGWEIRHNRHVSWWGPSLLDHGWLPSCYSFASPLMHTQKAGEEAACHLVLCLYLCCWRQKLHQGPTMKTCLTLIKTIIASLKALSPNQVILSWLNLWVSGNVT